MCSFDSYREDLREDVLQYAKESAGYIDSLEKFRDEAFISDSVTGNASGSYYCNAYRAAEKVGSLIYSDELLQMFQDFGFDRVPVEKGAEFIDVSIRCFLLDEVISEHEDEIKEILKLED